MLNLIINDPSNVEKYYNNDCAINAICNATGFKYSLVIELAKKLGRGYNAGTPNFITSRILDILGVTYYRVQPKNRIPLKTWLPDSDKIYLVDLEKYFKNGKKMRSQGHLVCVKHGNLIDTWNSLKEYEFLVGYWELE